MTKHIETKAAKNRAKENKKAREKKIIANKRRRKR
jgi:hypothetical protein